MSVQIIDKNGKPEYAIVPYDDYKMLLEKAEEFEDLKAYDEAVACDEESFPAELVDRLVIEKENPVKVFREYRGLTQAVLAEKVGASRPYIAAIESGTKQGSISMLKRLAEALEVDLDMIV